MRKEIKMDMSQTEMDMSPFDSLCLVYGCAEWHQRQFGHLEVLEPKRDTYDRDTENDSEYHRFQRQRNSGDQQPYQIYQKGYCPSAIVYFFPEGTHTQTRKLKTL